MLKHPANYYFPSFFPDLYWVMRPALPVVCQDPKLQQQQRQCHPQWVVEEEAEEKLEAYLVHLGSVTRTSPVLA